MVKTVKDFTGEGIIRRNVDRGNKGEVHAQARCEFCFTWAWEFLLVDVRGLPSAFRQGRRFACDGCRSTWRRNRQAFTPAEEAGKETARLAKEARNEQNRLNDLPAEPNNLNWRADQKEWRTKFVASLSNPPTADPPRPPVPDPEPEPDNAPIG